MYIPNQNNLLYLPIIVKEYPITESGAPACRWPRNYGSSDISILYKWGSNLQTPGSNWRMAFESGISDWNNATTYIYFYEHPWGIVIFNTYYLNDGLGGYAVPHCNGTITTGYDVYGNLYSDQTGGWTVNIRHAYAGHETGHSQSIGHIVNSAIALMGTNPDPNVYFIPQPIDINFVNQIYP